MSFLALLAALVLGHYRPLSQPDWLQKGFCPFAATLDQRFNDGRQQHGVIAWLLAVLLPVIVVTVIYLALLAASSLLAALFSLGLLYVTLHFGRLDDMPEQIAARLRDHNLQAARDLLGSWQKCESQDYSAAEVSRVGIEAILRQAHHALIAPIFWFLLLGPAGALLYRLSHALRNECPGDHAKFGGFAQRAFDWLDWLPARFTAACFAVAGDFEDAVYCWRTQAAAWPEQALGIVLASGAGALGVRLGEPLPSKGVLEFRPELGTGDEADADYLRSAMGLVWRALVLILGLLLLLTFAHWLGN